MSLIQDALKRKSEEPVAVPLPAETSAIPVEPPPEKKNPQTLVIILIILLTAGLIVALIGLSLYLIKPKSKPVATRTIINVSAQKPVVPPEEPAPATVVEPAVVKAPEPVPPPEPVRDVKPVWPELRLTGIAQAGEQSLAVLNGKMLTVGRKLGDVTLVEVNDGSIVVEYGGERRTLYINE